MKIFPKILMIFNVLIMVSLSLKAQNKDHVITTQGDTLACTITGFKYSEIRKYKTDKMKKPVRISVDDIKEYYVREDDILHRKVLERPGKASSAKFMIVLENGKISLYEDRVYTVYANTGPVGGMSSDMTTTWYISKGSDTLALADPLFSKKKGWKDAFAEMLEDNKDAHNKYLADQKFGNKQIRNLIHLYNTGKPLESEAGKDYVVKKNQDTIFCEIELATFNSVSRYRPTTKDKFIKIDTNITAYFLYKDSSTFLLKTLPNEKRPQYVKCLAKGEINLYAYSPNNTAGDSEATLYASKRQGGLALIKDEFHRPGKNEKKAFTDLISDNPNLVEKFTNLPYNFESVLSCVKTYNNDYLNNSKSVK